MDTFGTLSNRRVRAFVVCLIQIFRANIEIQLIGEARGQLQRQRGQANVFPVVFPGWADFTHRRRNAISVLNITRGMVFRKRYCSQIASCAGSPADGLNGFDPSDDSGSHLSSLPCQPVGLSLCYSALPFCATLFTVRRAHEKVANPSSAMACDCGRSVWHSVGHKPKTATRSCDSCAKRRHERKRENLSIDKPETTARRPFPFAIHISELFRVGANPPFLGVEAHHRGSVDFVLPEFELSLVLVSPKSAAPHGSGSLISSELLANFAPDGACKKIACPHSPGAYVARLYDLAPLQVLKTLPSSKVRCHQP